MNTILAFIFKMLLIITPYAPGTVLEISGRVTDSSSGKPIEKVYVYSIPGEEETLSDDNGRFRLASWQTKPVKVYFEKKGYKKKEMVYTANSSNNKILLLPE